MAAKKSSRSTDEATENKRVRSDSLKKKEAAAMQQSLTNHKVRKVSGQKETKQKPLQRRKQQPIIILSDDDEGDYQNFPQHVRARSYDIFVVSQ